MFSNQTPNYGLPQWQNNDTPTWLSDMNGAFANIDNNLKRVEEKADAGGVPQSIIDRIEALETNVTNILAKIGTDVIDTIGTSITNAIVNLKSAIDTASETITIIINKIGDTDISDVGNSITQAIRNLADTGVPQTIIDRIVELETNVTNILAKIGTDVIDTIGTSITNAIINLKSAIDTITTKIGETDITVMSNTITGALEWLYNYVMYTIQDSIRNIIGLVDELSYKIDDIVQKIGNVNIGRSITSAIGDIDIGDVGDSITQAIRNLADRIELLETNVTNILTQIGADAISGIGTSITNAIVNLNTALTTATNNITTIIAQIGTDAISGIGTSITNAIVNLNTALTTATNNITTIIAQIGTDVITGIGTSITNAIVNLKNRIDNITTLIGDTDISDVGNSITQAIRNLADTGVPQTIIDRIEALETNVTNILAKIGTDVIDTIGTSITNAIVNLKSAIDTKLNKNWTYVGILSASTGSTITVEDDWNELLLAIRVSEGSNYYNLTNVLPKDGFTRGNPSGNQTFAGFFWNESYNAKLRLGLEGTDSSRKLKLNYSNAAGWSINGIYVLKR